MDRCRASSRVATYMSVKGIYTLLRDAFQSAFASRFKKDKKSFFSQAPWTFRGYYVCSPREELVVSWVIHVFYPFPPARAFSLSHLQRDHLFTPATFHRKDSVGYR